MYLKDETSEGKIEDDNFWEAGNFNYTGNVHPNQQSKHWCK